VRAPAPRVRTRACTEVDTWARRVTCCKQQGGWGALLGTRTSHACVCACVAWRAHPAPGCCSSCTGGSQLARTPWLQEAALTPPPCNIAQRAWLRPAAASATPRTPRQRGPLLLTSAASPRGFGPGPRSSCVATCRPTHPRLHCLPRCQWLQQQHLLRRPSAVRGGTAARAQQRAGLLLPRPASSLILLMQCSARQSLFCSKRALLIFLRCTAARQGHHQQHTSSLSASSLHLGTPQLLSPLQGPPGQPPGFSPAGACRAPGHVLAALEKGASGYGTEDVRCR